MQNYGRCRIKISPDYQREFLGGLGETRTAEVVWQVGREFSGCFASLCMTSESVFATVAYPNAVIQRGKAPKDPAKQEQTATNGISILPSTQNVISLPICFLSLGELIALP